MVAKLVNFHRSGALWRLALALVVSGFAGNAGAEQQLRHFDPKFDRYEQITCGARIVDFLSALEVYLPIDAELEAQVAQIDLSFPDIEGDDGATVGYQFRIDRDFERKDGREAVIYPPGIFGSDIHVETHRAFCVGGICDIVLQFYPHDMLPEGDYPDPVTAVVSLSDSDGKRLADLERVLDIPARLTGFTPEARFEDFNVMLEPGRAIVEPMDGYKDRLQAFLIQIADDNGWREIELLEFDTSNGFWVVGYEGELSYLGVLAVDDTGVWENKVELVDLQRDWPVAPFGGQCRR